MGQAREPSLLSLNFVIIMKNSNHHSQKQSSHTNHFEIWIEFIKFGQDSRKQLNLQTK